MRKDDRAILVEGYMDAIGVTAAGLGVLFGLFILGHPGFISDFSWHPDPASGANTLVIPSSILSKLDTCRSRCWAPFGVNM